MKRKSAWLSFAACALVSAHPVKAAVAEKAAAVPASIQLLGITDFSKVQTVAVEGGVGFFDSATGTMYTYDSSLTQCVSIKKLKNLGQPAETIHHT